MTTGFAQNYKFPDGLVDPTGYYSQPFTVGGGSTAVQVTIENSEYEYNNGKEIKVKVVITGSAKESDLVMTYYKGELFPFSFQCVVLKDIVLSVLYLRFYLIRVSRDKLAYVCYYVSFIGYASKKKENKRVVESKYKTYYVTGGTGLFGLSMTNWTIIASVLMGLADCRDSLSINFSIRFSFFSFCSMSFCTSSSLVDACCGNICCIPGSIAVIVSDTIPLISSAPKLGCVYTNPC